MKIFAHVPLLCLCAASSATCADSWEINRERYLICSQFVIERPASILIHDATKGCCRVANRIRDCHVHEWH